MNVIHENAPFKVLNCAQYHNNPELLSGYYLAMLKVLLPAQMKIEMDCCKMQTVEYCF